MLYQRLNALSITAFATLTIGISGCSLHHNTIPVATVTASALAPTSHSAGISLQAQTSTSDAVPLLVEYFFADKGKHYADYAKQINFAKMTHLNLAFGVPQKCDGLCNANSDMEFSIAGQSDADIAAIVTAAHTAGAKVMLSIGGGGGDQ